MQTRKKKPVNQSPIDRMIRLIAEIEVTRYFEENRAKESGPNNDKDKSSDLRTL